MAKGDNKTYVSSADSMPWDWRLTPVFDDPMRPTNCPGPSRLIALISMVNISTFLFTFLFAHRYMMRCLAFRPSSTSNPTPSLARQILTPLVIVGLHLTSFAIIGVLIRTRDGYSSIPIYELVFLLVSLPRIDWLFLIVATSKVTERDMYVSSAVNGLRREALLLLLSQGVFYRTVIKGAQRKFYVKRPKGSPSLRPSAKTMYNASICLIIGTLVFVPVFLYFARKIQLAHRWKVMLNPPVDAEETGARAEVDAAVAAVEEEVKPQKSLWERWRGWRLGRRWRRDAEKVQSAGEVNVAKGWKWLFWSCTLVFILQWVWWAGFVRTARERFCPPKDQLPLLGFVWAAFTMLGIVIGALG